MSKSIAKRQEAVLKRRQNENKVKPDKTNKEAKIELGGTLR